MACNVVVLISGSGSNLQALIDAIAAGLPARIGAVISNRADAYGLVRAQNAGIATAVLDHKGFDGREAFDRALIERIDALSAAVQKQGATAAKKTAAKASATVKPAVRKTTTRTKKAT